MVGLNFNIKNLNDKYLHIMIDDVINNETVKVIYNQGIPDKNSGSLGDLLITFTINYPHTISDYQRTIITDNFKEFINQENPISDAISVSVNDYKKITEQAQNQKMNDDEFVQQNEQRSGPQCTQQ
jgi:DnaJ-class molecular chaperone